MVTYSIYDRDGRVMRYAETFAQLGHRVDVIALSHGDRSFHRVIKGVHVYRVQARTHREKGKFSYLFGILSFFIRASLFLSYRDLKQKYDLVHVHSVPDFMVFTAWLPKLRKAKIILDIHDILPELYASKFGCADDSILFKSLLLTEKWSAAFSDHVIVANHIWRDRLVSRSMTGEKCTAILNFPDRSIFARRGRTRNDDKIVMIYPGSMNWHQGLDIAIRAFARIKDAAPNSEFHLYGVGPALPGLKTLAAQLGLEGRLRFNEHCELREIVAIIENADFGVVPKRNDPFGDEAFSTKILEFMTMGVPVIVSGTKIDRYYFNDSVVRFFSPGDDKDLAAAMLALIKDPELRRGLSENALKFAEGFDWTSNKHRYLDIVDRLTLQTVAQLSSHKLPGANPESSSANAIGEPVAQYFRYPPEYSRFAVTGELSADNGYFRCGENSICYGTVSSAQPSSSVSRTLHDALALAETTNSTVTLPFDIGQVLDNLRLEVYAPGRSRKRFAFDSVVANMYYFVRPLLSVSVRKYLQKLKLKGWQDIAFPSWPVDFSVDNLMQDLLLLTLRAQGLEEIPFIWFWPDGASSCAVMTHDVETTAGRDYCGTLMDINDSFGIKSSFQVVPEMRYEVPQEYLSSIRDRGFEVNVQDLNHDGHLYKNHPHFVQRAAKINAYGADWNAKGFRAGILYRNEKWFDELQFEYDMSVPNVAHLDPQRGGCCTVMPYFIGHILELPVTMTQDYSLFHILDDYSLDLWQRQSELIMAKNGLMNFIVHPDYIIADRARKTYEGLLSYLAGLRAEKGVWIPTPGEVNTWWRQRAKMELVKENGEWYVRGEGRERARIAFARESNGKLEIKFDSGQAQQKSEHIEEDKFQASSI